MKPRYERLDVELSDDEIKVISDMARNKNLTFSEMAEEILRIYINERHSTTDISMD